MKKERLAVTVPTAPRRESRVQRYTITSSVLLEVVVPPGTCAKLEGTNQ